MPAKAARRSLGEGGPPCLRTSYGWQARCPLSASRSQMHKTVVLNVVGLTPTLLGASMPALSGWAREAAMARIRSAFPAVTCTAQSDYVTGRFPETHGTVG